MNTDKNNDDDMTETIRALTPIALMLSGVIVSIVAFLTPGVSDAIRASGMGVAAALTNLKPKASSAVSSSDVGTVNVGQLKE